MKQFYDSLVDVAKMQGYDLNYEKEEAYSATWMGEFGDSPKERKACFAYYWNDRESYEWEETLQFLTKKGYNIRCNFHEKDVLLGNVVVEIDGKWFAIGECRRDDVSEPYVAKVWSQKYVLANIKSVQTQLRDAIQFSVKTKSK